MSRNCFYIIISLIVLNSSLSAREAASHPHVFIVNRYCLVFDDNGLAGIRVNWQFDEYFSAIISADYDADNNGKIDPSENQKIKEEAFDNLKDYGYFTFIKIDNTAFEVRFVRDFSASLDKNILTYEFFIPCHVTAFSSFKEIRVAAYDPSYYTAVYFADKIPLS
ncbi:MAG: DUF1007 family protein, partial [Deltaproteobacteria bacterium]|nr:DUF1007 family protein [Deltaproteobacteria bacterium]